MREQETKLKKTLKEEFDKIITRIDKVESSVINNINKIKNVEKEMSDLKESLTFTEDVLDKKIWDAHDRVDAMDNYFETLSEKLRDLEDRNRRNNIRIEGIRENRNETDEITEIKVRNLFKNQLGIEDDIEIERVHRTGLHKNGKPRTIVMKLLRYKDKTKILKNRNTLKHTSVWINEDFSKETLYIRKQLAEEIKERKNEGETGLVIRYDRIVKIKTRNRNNNVNNQ